MDDDLFETISKEEFEQAQPQKSRGTPRRRSRAAVTEPRINTVWFVLPHVMGYCTCPQHDEIQAMLNPGAKVYRQRYPVRMTYEIQPGMSICRDCFIAEGDK